MQVSKKALTAIQAAGSATYRADIEARKLVKDFADEMKAAMLNSPLNQRTEALFEQWKIAARISQALAQIEVDFKKIYSEAIKLSDPSIGSNSTTPALVGPRDFSTPDLEFVEEIKATDIVEKRSLKRKKPSPKKVPKGTRSGGNTARVLARLTEILNSEEFVKINQSSIAADIGLPKGSIGASVSKLIKTGQIVAGPTSTFKLSVPSQG